MLSEAKLLSLVLREIAKTLAIHIPIRIFSMQVLLLLIALSSEIVDAQNCMKGYYAPPGMA